MPIVVVQTIARVTMKAAAAANTGRQRAAIHHRTGNSSAIGTTVVQGSGGSAMTITLMTMSDASAARPSMVSFGPGGARVAEASPITSGAIVMIPSASDANQFCQVTKSGAVGSEQGKAKPCREDIKAADHDGEPAQAHPPPRRISRVGSQRDELAPLHVGHRDSLPRWRRRLVYRTLNLPQRGWASPWVNCSQSRSALQPSCAAIQR